MRPEFEPTPEIPHEMVALVASLWEHAPSRRPRFAKVCSQFVLKQVMLNGVDQAEFDAYLRWIQRSLKFVKDEAPVEMAFDRSFMVRDVKRALAESRSNNMLKLTMNGEILANEIVISELPDELIQVESYEDETAAELKQRIAAERAVPIEALVVQMDDEEVPDNVVPDSFDVMLRVQIRESSSRIIPILVRLDAKASAVIDKLVTDYSLRRGFLLLSAGIAVNADESLAGLDFPLELRKLFTISFFIQDREKKFDFFEGEVVEDAITKIINEMPGRGKVRLNVDGVRIEPRSPMSDFQGRGIVVTFQPNPAMPQLQLRYHGHVIPIMVALGRMFDGSLRRGSGFPPTAFGLSAKESFSLTIN
jgi:hypothetical protein